MARRGNGQLHGVGRGARWPGPTRGADVVTAKAPAFKSANRAAVGQHDMSRSVRRQELLNALLNLTLNAESEELQVSAAITWLNRAEGKPIVYSVQMPSSPA